MEDRDIWIAANQLIKMFGDDAELMAARRADKAIEMGDPFNEGLWIRVAKAVRELRRNHNEIDALN